MTIRQGVLAACLVLWTVIPAWAQTIIDNTTLSAAIDATQTRITVASATGAATGALVYVDREAMEIQNYSSGTSLTVRRGAFGTVSAAHQNAAVTFIGAPERFHYGDPPAGSCTRSSQRFMPWVSTSTSIVWGCNNVTWFATVQEGFTYSSRTLQ